MKRWLSNREAGTDRSFSKFRHGRHAGCLRGISGPVEILGTVVSAKNPWSAACVDVVNTYYGRPDLPIDVPKGPGVEKPSKDVKSLAEQFPHDLAAGEDAPGAVQVYRDVLTNQPDASVVVVTVGYLTNLAALLHDPGNDREPSGPDLVKPR